MAGLAVLSVCGFITGLRLYMPHHRTVAADTIQITTPAPTIPTAAPVAVAQAEPTAAPHRGHARHVDADAVTDAWAPIGDQANAAALTPAARAAADDTDSPAAERVDPAPARPDETPPAQNAGPAPDQDR